jgi:hypothetical protein
VGQSPEPIFRKKQNVTLVTCVHARFVREA